MKTKRLQFGPGDGMGGTARLFLLGSIDACEPRRRRQRGGLATGLFWLLLFTSVAAATWVVLDKMDWAIIPNTLF